MVKLNFGPKKVESIPAKEVQPAIEPKSQLPAIINFDETPTVSKDIWEMKEKPIDLSYAGQGPKFEIKMPSPMAQVGFKTYLDMMGRSDKASIIKAFYNPDFALKLLKKHTPTLNGSVASDEENAINNLPILSLSPKDNLPSHDDSLSLSQNIAVSDDITLDPSQLKAINGIKSQQYACMIGAAGTGKTTVEKRLIKTLEANLPIIDLNRAKINNKEDEQPDYFSAVACGAFTGRAVQQMKRALPLEYHPVCQTIHSHLGYMPEFTEYEDEQGNLKKTMRFYPTFTKYRKLPYKLFFIDEAGMLPIKLWNELYDALPDDCRIIMIGDINQLPPVQGRSVFGFAMTKWPVYELTEIWRQKIKNPDGTFTTAEANPIVENAWKVLQGQFPKKYPQQFDMLTLPDGSIGAFNGVIATIAKLYERGQFDPLQDALIVPQNKAQLGQVALNERLVAFFNPAKKDAYGKIINRRTAIMTGMGSVVYGHGDKVMLLQNDRELGLTNGMTGVITDIEINGMYKGSGKYMSQTRTHGELDFDDMMSNIAADEKIKAEKKGDDNGDEEKEDKETNQRQATHIVTVRFGVRDPSKEARLTDIKEELKVLQSRIDADDHQPMMSQQHYMHLQQEVKWKKIEIQDLEDEIANESKEVKFQTAGDFKKLTLAYAITCHKSQGGEYPTVVIVCHASNIRMLTREWLYTAITRAKSRVILLSNDRGLEQALRVQRIKGSTTKEKVESFMRLIESEAKGAEVDLPNLPESMTILTAEQLKELEGEE